MAVVQPKIWGTQDVVHLSGVDDLDAVTMLPNGGYVVTWRQSEKVAYQLYSGNGDKIGSTQFVATPIQPQWQPDVLTTSDGGFVITWTEAATENSGGRILRSQSFDIKGVPNGPATTLNETTQSDGAQMSLNGQNGWATAYVENVGGINTVRLVQFDASGAPGTPVSISTENGLGKPDVAWIGGTQHVVSYLTGVNSGFAFNVVDGSTVGTPVSIPNAVAADVVALKNNDGTPTGTFVVVYDTGNSATSKIQADVYAIHGGTLAKVGEHTVSTGQKPSEGDKASVTALRDGGFAVAYVASTPNVDTADIWVRIVDASGEMGPAFKVHNDTGVQRVPSISEMADGRLSVSWYNGSPPTGGSAMETTIVDARAAAVIVTGTNGNDIYAPSAHGGDDFNGGDGTDTLTFKGASSGVAVNLTTESGSAGDAAGDTYTNFENIIGSKFADNLTGNAVGNVLASGSGDDVLNGAAGADVMNGGTGNDVYYVDNSGDVVQESGAADGGYDTVYASATYTLPAFVENLLAQGSSAINLTGNASNNRIVGNEAANALAGLGGNDTLEGAGGNDNLDGGEGNDALYGGAGDDALVGGGGNDHMEGGDGNDNLNGGEGNDVLVGGIGADMMNGGAGNDTYYIDNPGDVVVDGAGFDTVIVTGDYNLASLSGIENIVGAGTASISFIGDSGHNTITGNDGHNIIYGHNGNDRLSGGAGNDRIHGGYGKDVMWGGSGRDVFVFDKKPHKKHKDRIEDFNPREDSFFVENKYFKVGKKGSLKKPAKMAKKMFYKGKKAHEKDDRFIYDKKKGKLFYDADGTGNKKQVEIASLDKNLKISASDFFTI